MLEQNSSTEIGRPLPQAALEQQQRRRMLIALVVLLAALVSVLIKDRQFWFPPGPSSESETPEQSVPISRTVAPSAKTVTPVTPVKHVAPAPAHVRPKSKRVAATAPSDETQGAPVITATNRAVLPPLEVEVVAGNQHRALTPGDSSVKLEMQPSAADASEQTTASAPIQNNASATSHAAAHVQLSPGSAQVVSRVDPSYPLLAKQMKVQGAVILEALISKTGSIQDIQVLSGPAILSEAAREAVKQWHFKPYYQGGRPVETEARITVNFTISTY
jgi:TonB family protein